MKTTKRYVPDGHVLVDRDCVILEEKKQLCQATFKEHCTYPGCDCDRPEENHPKQCRCEVCRFWS